MTTPNTTKKVEEIAGHLWRCIKEDFERNGVTLPDNWNGVGMAYGGYSRAIEILTTLTTKHQEELEKAAGIERWNIGAWIEQQDFAQKEGERNNDPASVWAVQTVIKQINQYLAAPTKTDKTTEV